MNCAHWLIISAKARPLKWISKLRFQILTPTGSNSSADFMFGAGVVTLILRALNTCLRLAIETNCKILFWFREIQH